MPFFGKKEDVKRVELVIITPETVQRYAPEALTPMTNGGLDMNAALIISKLFPYPPQSKVSEWIQAQKIGAIFPKQQGAPNTPDEAVQMALTTWQQQGHSVNDIKKLGVWFVTSGKTEPQYMAYLFILGQVDDPSKYNKVNLR